MSVKSSTFLNPILLLIPEFGVQYHMPEAYDKADRVTQDKRFAVALERYRLLF